MNYVEYRTQKDPRGSTGFAESTGSHGFHGSTLVYTKSSWKFWVQLVMLGGVAASGIWIQYRIIVGLGLAGIFWLGCDRLSRPYNTIQITEEKIILLRKRHIYREYIFQAQNSITLNMTRHFRDFYHFSRLKMRLHNFSRGRGHRRRRGPTVIRFKHFVSSSHKRLLKEVQEIRMFLEDRVDLQVTVRESCSLLHFW